MNGMRNTPTIRKVRNRGHEAIAYNTENGWRYGWAVGEQSNGDVLVVFPGADRNMRISVANQRHLKRIGKGTLTGRTPPPLPVVSVGVGEQGG